MDADSGRWCAVMTCGGSICYYILLVVVCRDEVVVVLGDGNIINILLLYVLNQTVPITVPIGART